MRLGWQKKWSLQPVLPRHYFFTKEIHRLLHGGEIEPPPGIAPGWLAYRASASLAMLWGRRKFKVQSSKFKLGWLAGP